MRFLLLVVSITLAVLIFVCSEQEKIRTNGKNKIQVETVEPFYYVALFHHGSYQDMEKVRQVFYQEIQKQQISVKDTLLGLFFNDPEMVAPGQLEWAIAAVLPDSQAVQKPLMVIKWDIPQVLKYSFTGKPEDTGPVYHRFDTFMTENHLAPAGPAVEYYLQVSPDESLPTDTMNIEIWFAVQSN